MRRKLLIAAVALLSLTACQRSNNSMTPDQFSVQCLNGVEYYFRTVGYSGYMAVKIDKDTLLPSRC